MGTTYDSRERVPSPKKGKSNAPTARQPSSHNRNKHLKTPPTGKACHGTCRMYSRPPLLSTLVQRPQPSDTGVVRGRDQHGTCALRVCAAKPPHCNRRRRSGACLHNRVHNPRQALDTRARTGRVSSLLAPRTEAHKGASGAHLGTCLAPQPTPAPTYTEKWCRRLPPCKNEKMRRRRCSGRESARPTSGAGKPSLQAAMSASSLVCHLLTAPNTLNASVWSILVSSATSQSASGTWQRAAITRPLHNTSKMEGWALQTHVPPLMLETCSTIKNSSQTCLACTPRETCAGPRAGTERKPRENGPSPFVGLQRSFFAVWLHFIS